MDENIILSKIKEIRLLFVNEKDGGRALVTALAKEFNSYDVNNRNIVIDFFIRELQTDKNGMRGLALPVLEDLEASEAASRIYETYQHILKRDDEKWEREIVTTLMKLRFPEYKGFYSDYIEKYVYKKQDNGYIFFLGVLFCRVDPDKALSLLSNYFIKHLSAPNQEMAAFFKNRMGYLVINFSKNPKDYTAELLIETARKNRIVGLRLKEIMLSYFHSDLCTDDDRIWIKQKIKVLNEINI
jgi:hypothetical protein